MADQLGHQLDRGADGGLTLGALTLVLGGQKAGKSTAALKLAGLGGRPVRLVTPARGDDPELAERIGRHRRDRPDDLPVEETFDLVGSLAAPSDDAVVIDALDTWLLDRMTSVGLFDVGDEPTALGSSGEAGQASVLDDVDDLVAASRRRSGPTLVVAGLVGMGMHGTTPVARRYEDLHGLATQVLGRAAERVLLVVAGRAIDLADLDVLNGSNT